MDIPGEPDFSEFMMQNEAEYKILIVDDEPMMLQLVKNYLVNYHFRVVTASTGIEALNIIEKHKDIDLIVLDIMMPELSGFEVCRFIREKYSLFELPIIILTVKDKVSDMIEGFEAGANDYILKPFDRRELLARAKTLIRLKKLTRANEILQEAIEIKNQFLNMTIHDLKNPLTVIMGLSDLIKKDADPKSDIYDFINLIGESAGLMHNLVNELLEAARIESGKLMMHKEPFDLNIFAKEMVDKNFYKAAQKKQNIIFEPAPQKSAIILADSVRIQEIMDNLISNAIKYSPLEKDITVSVKYIENGKEGFYVRFEVKDKGPGLTDDDKMKIFGRFQRLSAQPTGGEGSTGLGLSIVKQLVDLHNGRIWAESEYGKGSTFIVELPGYIKHEARVRSRKKSVEEIN